MDFRAVIRKSIRAIYQHSGLRRLLADNTPHPLAGDRCIEWQWVLDRLPSPPAAILDIGCVHSYTAGIAAMRGLKVTGLDLLPLEYGLPNLTFIQGDVTKLEFPPDSFDAIVLCSTIEHVGIEGRFSSVESEAGDITLMAQIKQWLKPSGRVILTIPVGRDAIFRPAHRIYGKTRLPNLLCGYEVVEEAYWVKTTDRLWQPVQKNEALAFEGNAQLYALGLFSLKVPQQ